MPSVSRRPLDRPGFRFGLRPCLLADLPGLYEATDESRERIAPWMTWLRPGYGPEDAAARLAQAVRTWEEGTAYEFAIHDRDDGRIAGSCTLFQIDRTDRFCSLAYWVRTSKVRLGAATQAIALIREFGFDVLGLNRLEIVVAEENRPSRAVAEKAGAIYEGRLHSRICSGDEVQDGHLYALIRPRDGVN